MGAKQKRRHVPLAPPRDRRKLLGFEPREERKGIRNWRKMEEWKLQAAIVDVTGKFAPVGKVDWRAVAKRMETRKGRSCKSKWRYMLPGLLRYVTADGSPIKTSVIARRLVRKLRKKFKVDHESQVNWAAANKMWSADLNRAKWQVINKMLPEGAEDLSFHMRVRLAHHGLYCSEKREEDRRLLKGAMLSLDWEANQLSEPEQQDGDDHASMSAEDGGSVAAEDASKRRRKRVRPSKASPFCCPNGHQLRRLPLPRGWKTTCSRCGEDQFRPSNLTCRRCDFDLCFDCELGQIERAKDEARAARLARGEDPAPPAKRQRRYGPALPPKAARTAGARPGPAAAEAATDAARETADAEEEEEEAPDAVAEEEEEAAASAPARRRRRKRKRRRRGGLGAGEGAGAAGSHQQPPRPHISVAVSGISSDSEGPGVEGEPLVDW